MSESPQPYRVLARKYRPQTFAELIGQDAMVQTLGNAIKRERIAHAFLLTGVRGVGKTSTARLIAKALNCIGSDGHGGPTISPCGVCEHCAAIAEGRDIDVIEIDAASHNGIDDIREISEAVRLVAFAARYKIYIIDEVHMLSKPAFNGLLKTLEEPPAHVKFMLATTEVPKVPVTVLSRCQRFDLRRIPADLLAAHFQQVVAAEGIEAEAEALMLVARAAEGSARDGLSILDQAIAHTDGPVTAAQVRDMLGLSDRGAIRALFEELLKGDGPAVLTAVARQHELGVDPATIVRGLLETCHGLTRAKLGGGDDPAIPPEARELLADWGSRLGFTTLHRMWQLLLKGHEEVSRAVLPQEACEMALLRIVHASQLPDPGELARRIASGEVMPTAPSTPVAPAEQQAALLTLPPDFAALVDLVEAGDASIGLWLRDHVGLIRYAPPELDIRANRPRDAKDIKELARVLKERTGTAWTVTFGDGPSAPSLRDQEIAAESDAEQRVRDLPIVKAAFEAFPEAELIGYRLDDQRSA